MSPGLAAALLTVDDLPPGWVESPVGAVEELCDGGDPLAAAEPDERADAGFAEPDLGLALSQVVLDLSSVGRAEDLLDRVRDGLAGCDEIESSSGIFELEEVEADGLGDEAVAVHLSGQTDLGELEAHLVYVRVRDRVAALALVGVGEVDEDLVRDAADKVVSRL